MPDPQGTIPTQPTTPTMTGQQLQGQMAAQRQAADQANQQAQQQLQQSADKPIFRRIYDKSIKRGGLVAFQYSFYKHDPSPLVLVAQLKGTGMISGLNLHYLTFRYVRSIIQMYCGKPGFGYGVIKGNRYIVNAYRSYKREGRRAVQVVDCEYLKSVLGVARSFRPNEIEAIRKFVQKQLRERMHPTPQQAAKQFQNLVRSQSHTDYGLTTQFPDGRTNPQGIEPAE